MLIKDGREMVAYINESCEKSLLLKCYTHTILAQKTDIPVESLHGLDVKNYRDIAVLGYCLKQHNLKQSFIEGVQRLVGRSFAKNSDFFYDWISLLGLATGLGQLCNTEFTSWFAKIIKENTMTSSSWMNLYKKYVVALAQNRKVDIKELTSSQSAYSVEAQAIILWIAAVERLDSEMCRANYLQNLALSQYPFSQNYFLDVISYYAWSSCNDEGSGGFASKEVGGKHELKKILLVGLEYGGADIEQVVIETKGLGQPDICGERAALPLYEYDVIVINPQSYSHFLFGRATEYSTSLKELGDLKDQNRQYDFGTIFDYEDRMKELNIAISQGTKVIWIAVEDKKEFFYGQRTSYQGYLNPEVRAALERSWIYRKKTTKLNITKRSDFSGYFDSLSQSGWELSWQPRSKDNSWLAETPEGYCIGKEISVNGKVAWLVTPPTSPESLTELIRSTLLSKVSLSAEREGALEQVKTKHISNIELQTYIGKIKLLLITATEIETKTIRKTLTPLDGLDELLEGTIDDLTYRIGKFGAYNAVHFQSGMGTTGRDAATLSTYVAINTWNPEAIVMIGIAFGRDPKKQKIGDVLVSETITSYEPMRVGDKTIGRGPTVLAGQTLLDRFRNMLDWDFLVSAHEKSRKIIGGILSGDKLVDNQEFKDTLFELFPNAIGGEMEGAGVFAAAARSKVSEWIVVKAICDWGDGSKTKESQPLAAEAATSLCQAVFSRPHSFDQLLCPTDIVQAESEKTSDKEVKKIEMLPIDIKLLSELSVVFTGHKMHVFFEELSSSRSVYLEMVTEFEIGINRLLAPDKKMRNSDLELARSSFLYAIRDFLNFSGRTFSTTDGVSARFYGGVSEIKLLTSHRDACEKDDVEYLELARKVYRTWEELHASVRELIPDFEWN